METTKSVNSLRWKLEHFSDLSGCWLKASNPEFEGRPSKGQPELEIIIQRAYQPDYGYMTIVTHAPGCKDEIEFYSPVVSDIDEAKMLAEDMVVAFVVWGLEQHGLPPEEVIS